MKSRLYAFIFFKTKKYTVKNGDNFIYFFFKKRKIQNR